MQDTLVAVSINNNNVAWGNGGVPDDLVTGACTVGDKKAMVGIKNTGGIALGICHRTGVVEQLAKLVDRVTDIGPQHVLAEELVKHLSHR